MFVLVSWEFFPFFFSSHKAVDIRRGCGGAGGGGGNFPESRGGGGGGVKKTDV